MVGPSCVLEVLLTVFEVDKSEFHHREARNLVFVGSFGPVHTFFFALVRPKYSLLDPANGCVLYKRVSGPR